MRPGTPPEIPLLSDAEVLRRTGVGEAENQMGARAARAAIFLAAALTIAGCMGDGPPPAPAPQPALAPPQPVFAQVGKASWYGAFHQGKKTASGDRFDMHDLTAAHRTLPLGTEAVVTNLENGRSVEVTVNDRGPYHQDRVIDLSKAAAERLGLTEKGVARVRIEVPPQGAALETATIGN
jgi:rare lipoprotein A